MKIINFKEHDYKRYLQGANKTVSQAQDFINEVQTICPLSFNNKLLIDGIHSSDATSTTDAIITKIEKQLQSAGINIKSIADAAIKDSLNKFWEVRNKTVVEDPSVLSKLQIVDNVVSLPADFEDKVKEQFSYILHTPEAIALHEKHLAMVDLMNDFFASCHGLSPLHYGQTFIMPGFNGSNKVEANTIDYERFSENNKSLQK